MKSQHLLLIVLLGILNQPKLTGQNNTFSKVIENPISISAYGIVATTDNNFLIAGNAENSHGAILRINTSGEPLSAQKYAFDNGLVYFTNLINCYESGIVVSGSIETWSAGIRRALITKMDESGAVLWSKSIGLSGSNLTATNVDQTADSGFILSGSIGSFYSGKNGLFAARLDKDGELLWFRGFESTDWSQGYTARQSADGGFLLVGFAGTLSNMKSKAVLIKTDGNGNLQWAKQYQTSTYFTEFAFDALVEEYGYLCLTNNGCIRTDNDGNVLSFIRLGNNHSSPNWEFAMPRIKRYNAGGYLVALSGYMAQAIVLDKDLFAITTINYLLDLTDVIETENKGILAVGNGPLIYVKDQKVYEPHIGLIASDSIGSEGDCNNAFYPAYSFAENMLSEPLTVNELTDATINTETAVVSPLQVVERWGCIDVIGNVGEKPEQMNIRIFPSHVKDLLTIEAMQPQKDAQLELFNAGMQSLLSTSLNGQSKSLNLSHLSSGIYFLKIISGNQSGYWKVIKE